MRRGPALLALLLATATPALAGDEANPEIRDAENDAGAGNAWGDLVAGWFNDTESELVASLKVREIQAYPPGYVWYTFFGLANQSYIVWAFAVAPGQVGFGYGTFDAERGEPTDFQEGQGEFRTGAPASVVLRMPKGYANASYGQVLAGPQAGSGQVNPVSVLPLPAAPPVALPPELFFQPHDAAEGADYVLQAGAPPAPAEALPAGNATELAPTEAGAPEPEPARTPGFEAGLLAAALVAVAVALRVRRR